MWTMLNHVRGFEFFGIEGREFVKVGDASFNFMYYFQEILLGMFDNAVNMDIMMSSKTRKCFMQSKVGGNDRGIRCFSDALRLHIQIIPQSCCVCLLPSKSHANHKCAIAFSPSLLSVCLQSVKVEEEKAQNEMKMFVRKSNEEILSLTSFCVSD